MRQKSNLFPAVRLGLCWSFHFKSYVPTRHNRSFIEVLYSQFVSDPKKWHKHFTTYTIANINECREPWMQSAFECLAHFQLQFRVTFSDGWSAKWGPMQQFSLRPSHVSKSLFISVIQVPNSIVGALNTPWKPFFDIAYSNVSGCHLTRHRSYDLNRGNKKVAK